MIRFFLLFLERAIKLFLLCPYLNLNSIKEQTPFENY